MTASIVPPSKPLNLKVADCGPVCIHLQWQTPLKLGQPTLSYYAVTYVNEEGRGSTIQTYDNAIRFSELVPGTTYQFTVVAISKVGNVIGRSLPSDPLKFPGKLALLSTYKTDIIFISSL